MKIHIDRPCRALRPGRALALSLALTSLAAPSRAADEAIPFVVDPLCADSGHCHLGRWAGPGAFAGAGEAVAVSQSIALVGQPGTGRVVVYRLTDGVWHEWQVLESPNGPGSNFGCSLDINSGRLLVGALGDDTLANNAGAAFFYELETDGYHYVKTVYPPAPVEHGHFGTDVSLGWEWAVVGEPNAFVGGIAHVYERNGSSWGVSELLIRHGADSFASAVAISGNDLFIGDSSDDTFGSNSGAVYYYHMSSNSGVSYRNKLFASDPNANDAFGTALDGYNGRLLVGAVGDDEGAPQGGAAYVFERGSGFPWYEEDEKLLPCAPRDSAFFGGAVAIYKDRLVVGADRGQALAGFVGTAYVFHYIGFGPLGWVLSDELRAADGNDEDAFGRSVALYRERVLVGARGADADGAGAAYFFSLTRKTEDGGGACAADVLADDWTPFSLQELGEGPGAEEGDGPELELLRPLVPGESSLIGLYDVEIGTTPVLLWGIERGPVPFGDDELWMLDPHLLPFPTVNLLPQVGQLLTVPDDPYLAGLVVYLQGMVLDPASPIGVSLSNARAARIGY